MFGGYISAEIQFGMRLLLWLRLFLLLLLTFPVYCVRADGIFDLGESHFEHLLTEDDFPGGNTITALSQDTLGYIWIGTENGLVRFDGYTYKIYSHDVNNPNSLAGGDVLSILPVSDGHLWVGTENGISVLAPETGLFTRHQKDSKLSNGLKNNRINALAEDDKGNIWVATDEGLHFLPIGKKQFIAIESGDKTLNTTTIHSLLYSGDRTLWIGSQAGLYYLKSDSKVFKKPFSEQNTPPPFDIDLITTLAEGKDHRIWFGTMRSGAHWLIPDKEYGSLPVNPDKIGSLHSPWVYGITQPTNDEVWLATSGGIAIFNTQLNKIVRYAKHNPLNSHSISNNDTTVLFTDQSGLIWVGTWGSRLNRTNSKNSAFRSLHPSLNHNKAISSDKINCLLESQDNLLYIGTTDNGVDIVDPNLGLIGGIRATSNGEPGIKDNYIINMSESPDKTIWIGTRGKGLYSYQPSNGKLINITKINKMNGSIHSVIAAGDRVLFSNADGTYLFNRKINKVSPLEIPENNNPLSSSSIIYNLIKQTDNTIWIATGSGLYVLSPNSDKVITIEPDPHQIDSISGYTSGYMSIDKQDRIWVATHTGHDRLVSWDGHTAKFESISKKVNDGNTLIDQGFFHFDDLGNAWGPDSTIDVDQWKQTPINKSNGFDVGTVFLGSSTQLSNGLILFGGTKGLQIVNPKLYQPWNYQPSLVATEININNQPTSFTTALQLEPLTSSVTVEFSSLDFTAPNKNRYAYQLQGYDKDWVHVDSERRSAKYTNLNPGEYSLVIKGTNRLKEWSPKQFKMSITQIPAWYQTIWFRLLILSLGLISIFALLEYRTRILRKRTKQLQKLVDEKTRDINSEKQKVEKLLSRKNEEFTNVSHEFRTPLTLILAPISQVLKRLKGKENEWAVELMKVSQRNAYRLLRMVEQLLNIETAQVKSITHKTPIAFSKVIRRIAESFSEIAKEKQIELYVGELEEVNFEFTPDAFERILLNLLSNAIKYTPSGGRISIGSQLTNSQLTSLQELKVTVSDTGMGIPVDEQESIFERFNRSTNVIKQNAHGAGIGLSLVKNLVELHKGRVELHSEPNFGSTFDIYLPIINPVTRKQMKQYKQQTSQDNISMELMSLVGKAQSLPHQPIENQSCVGSNNEESNNKLNKILVIEDNNDMRQFIASSISNDYQVLTAIDGEQGLQLATDEIPDLIISDVMMPKMDGFQVVHELRRQMTTNHIPIILLTAKGDKESRMKGWEENADEYLTKPFDVDELSARIRNLLGIRDLLKKRYNEKLFKSTILDESAIEESTIREVVTSGEESSEEPVVGFTAKNTNTFKDEGAGSLDIKNNKMVSASQSKQDEFIDALNNVLQEHYMDAKFNVPQIAEKMGMSRSQLYRKISAVTDIKPKEYLRFYRLEKAKLLLDEGVPVNLTADQVGFYSAKYFTTYFKRQYNCSASEYKSR